MRVPRIYLLRQYIASQEWILSLPGVESVRILDVQGIADRQRRIIATDEEEFVTLDRIVSKAFFGEDDSTTSAHPSFSCTERFQQGCATRTFKDVVPLQHPMSRCQTCHSSFAEQEADYNTFRNRHQPPSADYYAGGGGGIIGGQRFFNCGHAVEMDGIACDTLQWVENISSSNAAWYLTDWAEPIILR